MMKKILAVLGLICAAASVLITLWLTVTGKTAEHLDLILISLSAFLGFGLLSLGFRWLENLKKEVRQEAEEEVRREAAARQESEGSGGKDD